MSKDIWLPDSKTHVTVEDGEIRIWDSMIMTRQNLNKSNFGFEKEDFDSEKEEKRS